MNVVLLESDEVNEQGIAALSGVRARHVAAVLGAKPGDEVRVGIVDGPSGTATVREVSVEAVSLACLLTTEPPPPASIDLLLAMPRPKVMKRLWAQLAALGVGRIILTNAARVEKNYFDTHVLEEPFYRPLLIEGLQQARDTRLPRVTIHKRFKPLIEDELDLLTDASLRIVADPSGTESMHTAAAKRNGGRVLLAIGPEGGWVPFELELLAQHRFIPVGLGPRTLRTDTATIALLALLHDALR